MYYLGFVSVAGWPIERLPCDVLVDFWESMKRRKAVEINDLSSTGAIWIAINQLKKEETKLDVQKWLPYDLGNSKISILDTTKAILIKLKAERQLSPAMLKDLYRNKIISPED